MSNSEPFGTLIFHCKCGDNHKFVYYDKHMEWVICPHCGAPNEDPTHPNVTHKQKYSGWRVRKDEIESERLGKEIFTSTYHGLLPFKCSCMEAVRFQRVAYAIQRRFWWDKNENIFYSGDYCELYHGQYCDLRYF